MNEIKLKDLFLRNEIPKNITVRLRHLGELIPAELDGDTLRFEQKIKRTQAKRPDLWKKWSEKQGG